MLRLFTTKNALRLIFPILIFSFLIISGCSKNLPEDKSIGNKKYLLVNQDSSNVIFPDAFKGKILVMSFIYTNCPNICPITTHNMQTLQDRVKKDNLKNVQFVELSFDPLRDTPSVLKEYGDIRNIDYSNFQFLTGNRVVIDTLLHHMNIVVIPGDTTYTKSGRPIYFLQHTNRITLLDQNARIRDQFSGSDANLNKILRDIRILGG